MDVIELLPRLRFLRFPAGHAFLWRDPDGLTLIDAGLPGSAPPTAGAIRSSGYQPADLRRLVLTHFHADHVGAAADIAGWGRGGGARLPRRRAVHPRRGGRAGPRTWPAGNGPSTTGSPASSRENR